jgi:hypothetical protein
VDRPIFQGLSQEALTMCIQSVASAPQAISTKKVGTGTCFSWSRNFSLLKIHHHHHKNLTLGLVLGLFTFLPPFF